MPINLFCLCVSQVLYWSLWIHAVVLSGWLAHPDLICYRRLKMDWIKDAEGLDLPILAVNSCLLFLLFHSIFLPLTNIDCAKHWPPRCLCRFSFIHSFIHPLTDLPLLISGCGVLLTCALSHHLYHALIYCLTSAAAITFKARIASCLRSPLTHAKACSAYLLCWIIWFPLFTLVILPFHITPV